MRTRTSRALAAAPAPILRGGGRGAALTAVLLAGGLGLAACGPPPSPDPEEHIELTSVEPGLVLPGTVLRLGGAGFLRGEAVVARVEGDLDGEPVFAEHALDYVSGTELALHTGEGLFAAASTREGGFVGTVTLRTVRDAQVLEAALDVRLTVRASLTPSAGGLGAGAAALMQQVEVHGEGFLLSGEGRTRLRLVGAFTEHGGTRRELAAELPVEVLSRTDARFVLTPEVLGIAPGTFQGRLEASNLHSGPAGAIDGPGADVELVLLMPAVASVTPSAVSRGQRMAVHGVGFLPSDPKVDQQTRLVLTGTFTDADGAVTRLAGADALELVPEYEAEGRLFHVLRPQVDAGHNLVGLGAVAGTFEGQVTTVVRHRGAEVAGAPWQGRIEVLPTKQVVFLKYLPAFTDALARFGMRNVEREVKDRILEVCARDYAPFNVEFREARPTDFVDYAVIELAGRDPNDAGLFGLDNTEGKDEGNLRLADVIGGRNAESEEQGFYAFGGVFLESFLAFSPSVENHAPSATGRFDEIFAPLVPELGGREVEAGEFPDGPRHDTIGPAIHALGSMVGNTVVHEIGHSLGLAAVAGYHHDGTSPGLIMNPGGARPFEERAEIDGYGAPGWGRVDEAYLQRVLPR